MSAGDFYPAEIPDPAEDIGRKPRSGLLAWWRRRTRLEKALIRLGIVAGVILAWHFLANNGSTSEVDISNDVKSSMQHDFDTDPRFASYHLIVGKVEIVRQTGNQYTGIATVRSPKGIDHEVPIEVTAEGGRIIWQSEPFAFAWMVLEQPSPTAPTTDSP